MVKVNSTIRVKENKYVPIFLQNTIAKVIKIDGNNIYIKIINTNDIYKMNIEDIEIIKEKLYSNIDVRSLDNSKNKRRKIVKMYRLEHPLTRREFKEKYAKELQELNLKDMYIDFIV